MAGRSLPLLALFLFAFAAHGVAAKEDTDELETYIILVRAPDDFSVTAPKIMENWYKSFLPPSVPKSRYLYSYTAATTGFAARLTKDEIGYVEKKKGFIARYTDHILPIQSTHAPSFMGNGTWNNSNMGKGVIIGLLDTGIQAGHPSFSDENMDAPPSKWRGSCNFKHFKCNKKVIGAKAFISQGGVDASARTSDDELGHGTHNASVAAGNSVHDTSVLGNANGTASGTAPSAHLAIYKVCTELGCSQADVLAGMDAAIKDGVDVLSLSIAGETKPSHDDVLAIGAFNAKKKGISVAFAAGNSGPARKTTTNDMEK